MPRRSLEPTEVLVGVFSGFMAPELAEILGPYSIIILASIVGAGWSLGGKEKLSRSEALWFFLKISSTAFLITVGITNTLCSYLEFDDGKWLFAPIAFFIGFIGDDWGKVRSWLIHRIERVISSFKKEK